MFEKGTKLMERKPQNENYASEKQFVRHDVIKWRHIKNSNWSWKYICRDLSFEVLHDMVSAIWKFDPKVTYFWPWPRPKVKADHYQKLISWVLDHNLYFHQVWRSSD